MKKRVAKEFLIFIILAIVMGYSSSALTITLQDGLNNNNFDSVDIAIYSEKGSTAFALTASSIDLSAIPSYFILGNGKDEEAVCTTPCTFEINPGELVEETQIPSTLTLITTDTAGNSYIFLKKYPTENTLILDTRDTIPIILAGEIESYAARKNLKIEQSYFIVDGFATGLSEGHLSLRVARDESIIIEPEVKLHYDGGQESGINIESILDSDEEQKRRDGKIEVINPFIRGDADGNGRIEITDAVYTLQYLFMGGSMPPCEDAADSDDNGRIEITDAVNTLQYLFMGGKILPFPYPEPGYDLASDELNNCVTQVAY